MSNEDFYAGPAAPPPATPPAAAPAWAPPVSAPAAVATSTVTAEERQMLAASAATSWENMHQGPARYLPTGPIGFLGSIRAGLQLIPVCWSVLVEESSLLIVPIIVMLATITAIVGYTEIFGGVDHIVGSNKYATALRVFPLLALVNAMSMTGEAVIVAASTDTLEGRRGSLRSAWVKVLAQLPRIIWFGVVFAAERTLTSALRGRRWSLGTLAANTIDRAWDFATFLVVPVLLYENLPVFASVKRSGQLVVKRWGVQLTARAVLHAAISLLLIPVVVIALIVAVKVSVVLGVAMLVVAVVAAMVVATTLTGILAAALYRFAITGAIMPGFSEQDMWAVFSRR
jgi:Family of unknown function (DUF6159)